jgi:hypothetical protein
MRTNHFRPIRKHKIGGQMKLTRGLFCLLLVFSVGIISFISLPQQHVIAQESNSALQRGYRTGYSDGYMAGYRDSLDNQAKDFSRHSDYASASRAYNKSYGPIQEYRDGYQQGFKLGYGAGFDKSPFDSEVPTTLTASADTSTTMPTQMVAFEPPAAATNNPMTTDTATQQPVDTAPTTTPQQTATAVTSQPTSIATDNGTFVIAKDTELILELQNELSTNKNKAGDKFTAKVVSPTELSGAVIEGRINKITKPGRLKRRSELSMSFDRIIISENRWGNFAGTLTEVLPVKGDNVRLVDEEGTAVSKSTVKPDVIKVGAATGTGATIGAVTGGPVGAAVGAGVGAAFGVGAVVIDRGKDIRLNVNQQLRVKSAYDTQIR